MFLSSYSPFLFDGNTGFCIKESTTRRFLGLWGLGLLDGFFDRFLNGLWNFCLRNLCFRGNRLFGLRSRSGRGEVDIADGMLRTYGDALTTQTALLEVDICQIVFNGDGSEVTLLLALATADTTDVAGLHGYRPLVLVDARDKDSPTLRTFLAEFDDASRTSLDTGTTGGTLFVIDLRDARLRVHADGTKLTGCLTVATTQTAEAAGRLSSATGMYGSTGTQPGILDDLRTILTGSVTSHDGHHRLGVGYCHSRPLFPLPQRRRQDKRVRRDFQHQPL